MPAVPGTICLWFGAIVDIPIGWLHCNGMNGTPNLKDRFVPGAGATYNPGDFGGSTSHKHSFTSDGHFHEILGGTGIEAGGGKYDETTVVVATGDSDNGSTIPKYHALAYMMKA